MREYRGGRARCFRKDILTGLIVFGVFCALLSGCVASYSQRGFNKGMRQLGPEPTLKEARENVLSGNITDAIIRYKGLIDSSGKPDAVLLSEYAYALALGGFFDFALANLDRARLTDPDNISTYFFAAQVFNLKRYPVQYIPAELWPRELNKNTPGWIRIDAPNLIKKYKKKVPKLKIRDLNEEFYKANLLISQRFFFQAVDTFRQITIQFPDEYIHYIGYSIALEKIGTPGYAVRVLKKALKVASSGKEKNTMKEQVKARIEVLENKVKTELPDELKTAESIGIGPGRGKQMLFLGGNIAGGTTDLNLRFGKYTPGGNEMGVDLGLGSDGLSLGLKGYSLTRAKRPGSKTDLIYGGGMTYSSAGLGWIVSIGLYSPVDKGRVDFLMNLEFGQAFKLTFTVGMTGYFGKGQ